MAFQKAARDNGYFPASELKNEFSANSKKLKEINKKTIQIATQIRYALNYLPYFKNYEMENTFTFKKACFLSSRSIQRMELNLSSLQK